MSMTQRVTLSVPYDPEREDEPAKWDWTKILFEAGRGGRGRIKVVHAGKLMKTDSAFAKVKGL